MMLLKYFLILFFSVLVIGEEFDSEKYKSDKAKVEEYLNELSSAKKDRENKRVRKSRLVTSDYEKDYELDTIKKDQNYLKSLNRGYAPLEKEQALPTNNDVTFLEKKRSVPFWEKKNDDPSYYNESRKALLDIKEWMSGAKNRETEKMSYEDPEIDSLLKSNMFRVSLFGGLSQVISLDTSIQKRRESEALTDNLMFGLDANICLSNYLGLDFEFGYGISPKNVIVDGQKEEEKSLGHLVGLSSAVGRVIVPMQHFIMIPKIMLGYGVMGLLEEVDEKKESLLTSGPIMGVGIDIGLNSGITFGLNYYSSLSAKTNIENLDSYIKRLAAYAMMKISNTVSLGIKYYNFEMALDDGSDTLRQVLGLISFEF